MMDLTADGTHAELRKAVRTFLAAECPLVTTASVSETKQGWDPGTWGRIAQLGWLGVSVPVRLGGAGLGFMEEAILLEEFGRALYPGPYMATVALAAPALDGDRLRDLAEGRSRWSAQLGPSWLVPNLQQVDAVVVEQDRRLVAVDAEGLETESVDPTRGLGRLRMAPGKELQNRGRSRSVRRQMRLRARAALALEAVGLAAAVLELGVGHAQTREQFGRPIGAYQAVAHKLADTYAEVELSRALAYWAARCIAEDDPEAELASAAARSFAAETAVTACERVIQVFGGMGFTWEMPLNFYYRRALWIERFGWSPARCRADVSASLLGRPVERGV